jgi:hypothetical protein
MYRKHIPLTRAAIEEVEILEREIDETINGNL